MGLLKGDTRTLDYNPHLKHIRIDGAHECLRGSSLVAGTWANNDHSQPPKRPSTPESRITSYSKAPSITDGIFLN